MNITITILLTLITFSAFIFNDSFAISPNSAFTMEGNGYAVTEDMIKTSEIDFALSTQKQIGSSIGSLIEDGFITLDIEDFLATEVEATILRDGKYIRINGILESDTGHAPSTRSRGSIVGERKNASIYGLRPTMTTDDHRYKLIQTATLSELLKIKVIPTESKTNGNLTIYIQNGSSTQGVGTYIDLGKAREEAIKTQSSTDKLRFRYFSEDRISVDPKTIITIVNGDNVSHTIQSGTKNNDRYNQYTADGRISTGEILPGKSINITLDEIGFYRLYDPNYQWMEIIAYVFPKIEGNVILGQGQNSGN